MRAARQVGGNTLATVRFCCGGVLLVLAASCGGGGGDDESAAARAEAAELAAPVGEVPDDLPDVEEPGDTRAWLERDGEGALGMVDAVERLLVDRPDCARVTGDLDDAGTPEELLAAAAGIPDPVTAQLLMDLHSTLLESLSSCGGADFVEHRRLLAWQWLVVVERLDEIGVES